MIYQTHYKKGSEKRGQDLVKGDHYICYMPEWSDSEHEVLEWDGNRFTSDNPYVDWDIDKYVASWSQFEKRSGDA